MNKSVRRCMFCNNESVKHDKSAGLTHSRVKTDIESIISLVTITAENLWRMVTHQLVDEPTRENKH